MGSRVLHARTADGELRRGIEQIRREQRLPTGFPPEVVAAAEAAARSPRLPDLDLTDVPFRTIDPDGAMDLDQAMHLERDGDGYVVLYAIADVMAFLTPGDPVDEEARRRGETIYGPESKIPLHPPALSEGAASLLPGEVRPAFVWTIRLDAAGDVREVRVERARVRSRERHAYDAVQRQLDSVASDSTFGLLEEVGRLRMQQEAERGGISLPMPAQEIDVVDGRWRLEFRRMLPVESYNAQISLLTGFAAAQLMIEGRVGLLRTLPAAPDFAVARLRRTARALDLEWPAHVSHQDFIRGLDPTEPAQAAMVVASTTLLRGASYAAFDGQLPEEPGHAALASSYAHVTAPLRRLVDRFGLETCAALCAGQEVPDWVRVALPDLPKIMRESGRAANAYENALLDLVEAHTLQHRVGERFWAVVTEADADDARIGTVMLRDPAVEARVVSASPLPVGEEVAATLEAADPETRKVRFTV